MNHSTVTLVTDLPPSIGLAEDGRVALRFGADDTFTVVLPSTMSAERRTVWCRDFAGQLAHVAGRIERKSGTVAP
jgi:hypothetical protein